MLSCTTVVGDAVAAVIGCYEGLLLIAVEFALGRIDGVGRGGVSVGVFIKLFATDIFPFELAFCLILYVQSS